MGSYKYGLFFRKKYQWEAAEPPADVKRAFEAYAGGGPHMTPSQLRRFLSEEQGDISDADADAQRFVEHLRQLENRPHLGSASRPLLGLEHFHCFLFSEELNPPIGSQVYQQMTAPLSHYYIYTGHNSYLTGNQLSSDCSDVPIKEALQRGVRVIELDMWPNSKKNDVDILHGRTLTAPVKLIKCLQTIKEYAFCSSPYPVVITIEDHLTPDLQEKVAEMVTQTFGGMLYYPETDSPEKFPCPEDLKNRIVLSTKPPKKYIDSGASSSLMRGKSMEGKDLSEDDKWGKEDADLTTLYDKNGLYQDDEDEDDDDDESSPQHVTLTYRHLITIRAGKPKGKLIHALMVDPDEIRRLSLSEEQLVKAAQDHGDDLIRFTQKNMLRIYPKGTRVDSSNYNPLIGWMYGAQMVAFNMQGYGRSLWLMQGFFRANGGCGYVKKPDFLLNVGPYGDVFNPKANLPVEKTLKVKLYMGDGWCRDFSKTHFDSYSPPDFYTKVAIAGVPADTASKKTRIIEDSWSPVWEEEFQFPLTLPEFALLRIEVHEYDSTGKDDFAGQTCLPVSELRPGIRCVPLSVTPLVLQHKDNPVLLEKIMGCVIHHIRVAQLQVVKIHGLPPEQRPRMPGPRIELQELRTLHPKNAHIIRTRRHVVMPALRPNHLNSTIINLSLVHSRSLGNPKEPLVAANGAEALRHASMVRDLAESQLPILDVHDVKSWGSTVEFELGVLGPEVGAVGGRGDHLAEVGEGGWGGVDGLQFQRFGGFNGARQRIRIHLGS